MLSMTLHLLHALPRYKEHDFAKTGVQEHVTGRNRFPEILKMLGFRLSLKFLEANI